MTVPPVLLVIFRRPETTAQVFEAIRKARPSHLYIAADGPRRDRPGEAEACALTRATVATVDWPCEVKRFFRDENVGIRRGVSEAVTWFLAEAGEGIILEDDCRPSPDFFPFAATLLERYRNDDRVMHINGSNFHRGKRWSTHGYYFSRYNHGWGWATWKRAWDQFDLELNHLEEFLIEAAPRKFWDIPREGKYWTKVLRQTRDGLVNTWDYQWNLALWSRGGLCVTPEANMITNIGFGEGATNTTDQDHGKGFMTTDSLGSWDHPPFLIRHRRADVANFLTMFWGTQWARFAGRVRKLKALTFGPRR
jgi:hypothetical protein